MQLHGRRNDTPLLAAGFVHWEKSADLLLIDERKGRKVAAENGINIIGVVGIFLRAKNEGMIPAVKPFLDLLVNDSYYISANLYQNALKVAKEN